MPNKGKRSASAAASWSMTPLGGSVHKCGRSRDSNRDTAKWKLDVLELLKAQGGEALKAHVVKACTEPRLMCVTKRSSSQASYNETFDDTSLTTGSTGSTNDVMRMRTLQDKMASASDMVESARKLRPLKKPRMHA